MSGLAGSVLLGAAFQKSGPVQHSLFSLVTMMWLDQRLRQDYRLRQREETIIGQLQQEANDKRNQDRTSMTSYVLESAIAFQQWKLWQVLVSFDPGAMDSWQILRLSISCSLHSAGHGSCWTAILCCLVRSCACV